MTFSTNSNTTLSASCLTALVCITLTGAVALTSSAYFTRSSKSQSSARAEDQQSIDRRLRRWKTISSQDQSYGILWQCETSERNSTSCGPRLIQTGELGQAIISPVLPLDD